VPGQRTYIMGVVNVTPDSFSDGGQFYSADSALDHALKLIDEGADILDIGGEATSPARAGEVSTEEELKRVIPVISALAKRGITAISVDTSKAAVAKAALVAGASWINDQRAGAFDALMPEVMTKADAVVLMHNLGQSGVAAGEQISYDDVCGEIYSYLKERINHLLTFGIPKERIVIDPGIGFGKGLNDSLAIINGMSTFSSLGAMSLIGISRKSFLGALTGIKDPKDRENASLGATACAVFSGANIIRTHNVKAVYDLLQVIDACREQGLRVWQ
jgi:dihydropteroate synthase